MRAFISGILGLTVGAVVLVVPAYASHNADSTSQASQASESQQPGSPEKLARQTVNTLLDSMDGRRDELRQHPKKLYELINNVLMPMIDTDYMAQLVLGRSWRNATPEQRQRFIRAFKAMIVRTYGNSLLDLRKKDIEYQPLRAPEGAEDVSVRALATSDSGDRVPVNLDMHLVNGQWKVYDATIGSLSFITNYRGQFRQAIHQGGLDQLIDRLEKRYDLSDKPLGKDDDS